MESQETQAQALTNSFDGIEKALDVEAITAPENGCAKRTDKLVPVKDTTQELKKDYEYTRGNLYSLIEKGQEAVDGILELAQESDQPRAYEVAGQLIKHVGDVADKLADLHKKVNDIENPKNSKSTEVTNNTMFVGSTTELAKFLKQKQDK